MTPVGRGDGADEDARPFEQWLLDSAREDELPRDVSDAWARFGASLGSASGMAASGGVGTRPSSGGAPFARLARSAAVKWLALGAIAGSALTLVWINRTGHTGQATSTALIHVVASAAPVISVPSSKAAAVSVPSVAPSSASASAEVARAPRSSSLPPRRDVPPSASNLGEQVALLDSARAALASGSFAAALQATDRYDRQFPTGELRPDAEVVAIEALSARGDDAACRERAARFLARYPNDPHALRVAALVDFSPHARVFPVK